MNPEVRLQLLKDRFRAVGGTPAASLAPFKKVRRQTMPASSNPSNRSLVFFGVSLCERRTAWMQQPDPKPSLAPKPARTAKKSALQRIADRWEERRLDPSWGRRNS